MAETSLGPFGFGSVAIPPPAQKTFDAEGVAKAIGGLLFNRADLIATSEPKANMAFTTHLIDVNGPLRTVYCLKTS